MQLMRSCSGRIKYLYYTVYHHIHAQLNLLIYRINLISNTFDVISGYSDHTVETHTPAFSMAMGARVIEKHNIR